MCDQKRATFSKVRMDEDGNVNTYYAMNVKKTHAILGVIALIITIVISLFTLRSAVYEAVSDFVDQHCSEQLDVFHAQVHPKLLREVDAAIDAKLIAHTLESEASYRDRIDILRSEIAALTKEVAILNEKSGRNQALLEKLVDGVQK